MLSIYHDHIHLAKPNEGGGGHVRFDGLQINIDISSIFRVRDVHLG